jgi:hypothetical protein
MKYMPYCRGAPPGSNPTLDKHGSGPFWALQSLSPSSRIAAQTWGLWTSQPIGTIVLALFMLLVAIRGCTPHRLNAGDLHISCPAISRGNFTSIQSGVDDWQLSIAGRCNLGWENLHACNTPQDKN